MQLVILLYLLDNNTSFIILASSAVGLAIEFWKVCCHGHMTRMLPVAGCMLICEGSGLSQDTENRSDGPSAARRSRRRCT